MTKTKTPFCSMGSTGTINNSLTTQKLGSQTMLRSKPIPIDHYTLPQAYQRWDYIDYASRWHDLDDSVKHLYAAYGSRCHLTGFQYWMRSMLKTLPDLSLRWRLDHNSPGQAPDKSKNSNTGSIFGATPAPGLISGCYSFDGIDDYISAPSSSSIEFGYFPFAIELFTYMTGPFGDLLGKYFFGHGPGTWGLSFRNHTTMQLYQGPGGTHPQFNVDNVANAWHHFVFNIDPSADTIYVFQNGLFKTSAVFTHQSFTINTPFTLCKYTGAQWGPWGGLIDHLSIYNRMLESHEALRHSLRRYPS